MHPTDEQAGAPVDNRRAGYHPAQQLMLPRVRIVSLLASATEIVCALDAGDLLAGRSHECDNPPWVRSLPACSEPAFDVSGSGAEIDREVTRRIRTGEPLYRIHSDLIQALAPDLIIAQSHCEVCAVTPADVEASGSLQGPRVISISASTLEDIFSSVIEIARVLGLEDRGRKLVDVERARLDRLRTRTASFRRPSIAVLEWVDPIYPMSNWGPELVYAANGELVLGKPGQHSSAVSCSSLWEANPEFIVIAPCGFNLERSVLELQALAKHKWWKDLRAVHQGTVAFADGNLFFNRSGMTVTRTAEILAEILHGVITDDPTEKQHWLWMTSIARET
jgi:iron complex transport system substrate-binding protein